MCSSNATCHLFIYYVLLILLLSCQVQQQAAAQQPNKIYGVPGMYVPGNHVHYLLSQSLEVSDTYNTHPHTHV